MGKSTKLVYECPNVENTLPLDLFRAQSPARYSQADGDKLVLYAGNSNCLLEVPSAENVEIHDSLRKSGPEMAIFILDTCVVLWFPGETGTQPEFGVELPYTSIVLHALKDIGGESVLYLQVLSCDIFKNTTISKFAQTVEIVVRVNENTANTADTGRWSSPLLQKNNTISQIYDALGTCSAFHYDESGSEDEDAFGPDHEWITADSGNDPQAEVEVPASWANSGDADDLGMADSADEALEGEAGMNVAVEYVTVAGVVRRRASVDEEGFKQRRLS